MTKVYGTLKCPICGHKQKMQIPDTLCMHAYKCNDCGKIIKGEKKCVFCTYGSRKCPIGC